MFSVNQRTKFGMIHLKDVYYAMNYEKDYQGFDLVCYYHCQEPLGRSAKFSTMVIDLDRDPEEILRSFRKKTRVQIEKALASNKIHFLIIEHPSDKVLEEFCNSYDSFAAKKNILPSNRDLLYKLNSANKLFIASASAENEALCQFVLIEAINKVVCYYGYNIRLYCLDNAEKVKLISQANRALEYYCMLYAREIGKKYYDLCGLTLDDNNTSAGNVDQYKMGFNGQIINEYHFMHPFTLKGRLFSWLKLIKKPLLTIYL